MKFLRLYADDAGDSHWEDVSVGLTEKRFAPPATGIELSEPEPATQMIFLRLRPGWNEPIHPTPLRQTLMCMAGCVRVTASGGGIRDIGPGDVWQMEDTHGKGHHTVVTSQVSFEAVVVQHG